MQAIVARDQQYPASNDKFLDALIDDVRAATGRIHGAGRYSGLLRDLAEQTKVTRRPSTTTVNKAVARAQALKRTDPGVPTESGVVNAHELRRILDPMLREVQASIAALGAGAVSLRQSSAGTLSDDALRLQITEASLLDALARERRQEEEIGRLQRELGQANARAEAAELVCREMLASFHQAISASAAGAEQLAGVARQLLGTERFLKIQNDAVRQQAIAEADRLGALVKTLRAEKDHLILDNDQFRRALAAARQGHS